VKAFRVIVIRPDACAGVTTKLQTSLEVNDEADFELHTLIPYKDGLLAVFVKDLDAEEMG
jgi:hypothetical protein